jgi:hypothetical protein
MAADVVPELNVKIQRSFQNNVMRDRQVARISQRIRDGTATLADGHEYAERLGFATSRALRANLTADTLPDGKLYYNIAKRTVTPALEENYRLINEASADIQKIIDSEAGIGLGAVHAEFPEERIQGMIDKMTTDGIELEDALKWLDEPIVNNSEAFFDDYVDKNAKFRNDVGLKATITRQVAWNCCDWCAELAGTYDYDNAPPDIYRRHEFCRCVVTYKCDKKSQNVWTKRSWESSDEEIQARQSAGIAQTALSATQRIEQINMIYRDMVISTLDISDRKKAIQKYNKMKPAERLARFKEYQEKRAARG